MLPTSSTLSRTTVKAASHRSSDRYAVYVSSVSAHESMQTGPSTCLLEEHEHHLNGSACKCSYNLLGIVRQAQTRAEETSITSSVSVYVLEGSIATTKRLAILHAAFTLTLKPLSHSSLCHTQASVTCRVDTRLEQRGSVSLYVRCCLCMVRRACQLASTGQGVIQVLHWPLYYPVSILPYIASPCPILHCLALLWFALHCIVLHCLALP